MRWNSICTRFFRHHGSVPFFVSIRWKIGGLMAALILGVAGLGAWSVPEQAAADARKALEERALATAAILADGVKPALEFAQPEDARPTLEAGRADRTVLWIAMYDPEGGRLMALGDGAPERIAPSSDARLLDGEAAAIGAMAPALDAQTGTNLGSVAISLASDAIATRREAARATMLGQALLVAAGAIILLFLLTGPMARSLMAMRDVAERIARGDVAGEIGVVRSNDEIGAMANAFDRMRLRLRTLQQDASSVAAGDLRNVPEGGGELFTAFRRMVENLRALASRIDASAKAVETSSEGLFSATRQHERTAKSQKASIEEMGRTLERLALFAERVDEDAGQVRDMAQRSLASSEQTADQTKLVSAHADRIGEILTLIQDIADKSDLLALNAALEGTKAGEVGRGFSLVAAEMRRLSEHVVDSVRDIRKLVADTRGASHASVLATEDAIKVANEVAASAVTISQAVAEQRKGTADVKGAADDIVSVVNESLDNTAEIARSAASLLELSRGLKSASSAFVLED